MQYFLVVQVCFESLDSQFNRDLLYLIASIHLPCPLDSLLLVLALDWRFGLLLLLALFITAFNVRMYSALAR